MDWEQVVAGIIVGGVAGYIGGVISGCFQKRRNK